MVRITSVAVYLATMMAIAASLSSCTSKADADTFGLTAAAVEDGRSARNRQILVPEPQALKALDSEQVVIRLGGSEIQYLGGARWSDRLPRLVQSKLVEAYENTGKLGGVGKPGEGLAIDYQVVTDIRSFEVRTAGASQAVVEISVKLLNDRNGTVRAQKVFSASQPVSGGSPQNFIAALNVAFGKVSADIVVWTLKVI